MLAFVPLGVLVYTIWQEKSWRFKLCCIVFTSIVLEVMQYILGVGASDITDVITNTLGGVAGLGAVSYTHLNMQENRSFRSLEYVLACRLPLSNMQDM